MAIQRTLSIIKPDAVAKNVIGQIIARFENAGLKVVAGRLVHLSAAEAGQFYAVHKERPFFKDLVEFMTSGPVFVQVLEGEDAIAKNRDLMGATDPKKAARLLVSSRLAGCSRKTVANVKRATTNKTMVRTRLPNSIRPWMPISAVEVRESSVHFGQVGQPSPDPVSRTSPPVTTIRICVPRESQT